MLAPIAHRESISAAVANLNGFMKAGESPRPGSGVHGQVPAEVVMSDELAEAVDAIGKSKARALLLRAEVGARLYRLRVGVPLDR